MMRYRSQEEPGCQVASTILSLALLAFFGIGLYLFLQIMGKSEDEIDEEPTVISQVDYKKLIIDINKKLTYSSIDASPLYIESLTPAEKFAIIVRPEFLQAVYPFQSMEYTFEGGGFDRRTSGLCMALEAAQDKDGKFVEWLEDINPELSVGVGVLGFNFELWSIIRSLTASRPGHIDILIKGAADGQHGPWKKDLKAPPYDYHHLEFHPKARSGTKNPIKYLPTTQTATVISKYTNNDLPNLRAKFIKEDIILPYLEGCLSSLEPDMATKVSVRILEGYEFSEFDSTKRKVEVYVHIY